MAKTTTDSVKLKASMTMDEINANLLKYRKITFKAGTYNVSKPMLVRSDTTITCEAGVIFKRTHKDRMLEFYSAPSTTKYNGTHDVTWTGGTFIANTNSGTSNVIVLCHSKNITLKNITIEGCVGFHSIEINSSKKIKVVNCTIKNQTIVDDKDHKESIQLDFAYKAGLSILGAKVDSPCYDATHCDNITISGCTFENCPNGIGTHTVYASEKYHTDITIKDCKFIDIKGNCVRLLGCKNVSIINSPGKIVIDKAKKGYSLDGTKTTLSTNRYNVNVVVDNIEIS